MHEGDVEAAVERLCSFWRQEGKNYRMGFSLYPSRRMPINTTRFGSWGENRKYGTSACREPGG